MRSGPAVGVRAAPARRHTRIRGTARVLLLAMLAVAVFLTTSIVVQAATAPGDISFAARLAEAARDDGFGLVVDVLQQFDTH